MKLDEETYKRLRFNLLTEYFNCIKHRWWLSARARVRKLAQLELEQNGIEVSVTYDMYNYDKIGQEARKRKKML